MKPPAPRSCTLTAARLDREADLDRDLAAVADVLHRDAGLLVDTAITRARETFRAGETVGQWWNRAWARPVSDAGATADTPQPAAPTRRHRRLSDHILIAFHLACDQRDLEVADRLLAILERTLLRPPPAGRPERRTDARPLVAAHERLWTLRHPEAGDG